MPAFPPMSMDTAESVGSAEARNARPSECAGLGELWHRAWLDAHASILAREVVRDRTLSQFQARMTVALPNVRVVGPPGEPQGFCLCKNDEVYQLFVAEQFRGAGVAAILLRDAEQRLLEAGVEKAWLACAIGNERAASFYRKHGWSSVGVRISNIQLSHCVFPLPIWRFEKPLALDATQPPVHDLPSTAPRLVR
jgi:GNAT superfamily N-acetyltransferase